MQSSETDSYTMISSLQSEGLSEDEINLEGEHIITDDGFLIWRMYNGIPYISHVFVKQEARGQGKGDELYRLFRDAIAPRDIFYVEINEKKDALRAMLSLVDPEAREIRRYESGSVLYLAKARR